MTQDTVSLRPDVFTIDPPTLLASRCPGCDARAFPPRDICSVCGAATDERVPLSRDGEIYSYAVVRQAPPGLPTPYLLAYVDLPEDEVRVLSRLEGFEPGTVTIGAPVRLATRPADGAEEGTVMFAFHAKEAS